MPHTDGTDGRTAGTEALVPNMSQAHISQDYVSPPNDMNHAANTLPKGMSPRELVEHNIALSYQGISLLLFL